MWILWKGLWDLQIFLDHILRITGLKDEVTEAGNDLIT